MAHRFVQQDARPARAQHHGHFARGCGARVEVDQRRAHGVVHVFGDLGIVKIREAKAPAAAGRAHLAAAVLLNNHGDRQTHQRAHIGCQRAIGARHQHHVVLTGQPRHDLGHTGVLGAGKLVNLGQQLDLGRAVERRNRVQPGVQGAAFSYLFRSNTRTA